MQETLKRLSAIEAPVCVTLILRTHKTHPENQKDSLLLKNLITEANSRLQKEYDAKTAKVYTEKLQKLAEEIDHNHNDNGLMLFVNDNVAEYLRISVRPTTRVILDKTFATRTIVRALKRDSDYYVLVLSRGKARFLEASSDSLIKEFNSDGFPVTESNLLSVSKAESANALKVTALTQEFFNRVDKSVNQIRRENPLPIFIYSEETNYHAYMKEADHPNTISGHILLKNYDEKPSNLIKNIWPQIREQAIANHRSRISELEKALNSGTYLSDLNDIWRAVQEGRGKTIFVEEGYYQPAKEENGVLTPINAEDISSADDINDIVDEMIEYNLKYGGDVVFIEKGGLEKFEKLALVTRY